jgi:hypothetical protein
MPIADVLKLAFLLLERFKGVPAGQPTAERQVDLCQKAYGEVSNYDRHYSTVRATLTALVVTIGLGAASDPVKTLFDQKITPPACNLVTAAAIVAQAEAFLPTLLLFGLAIAVSMYFQRLTYACALLERDIERHVIELSGGTPPQRDRQLSGLRLTYFGFRHDLAVIYRRVAWLHADAMTRLLLSGITGFISFVAIATLHRCGFWTSWYGPLAWFVGPMFAVWWLARLVNFVTR